MRLSFAVFCGVTILVQCYLLLHATGLARAGDFARSREFGRRFLVGAPLYANGLHYPYMPSAAMLFSPLALANFQTALFGRYIVAIGCLYATLRMLNRMCVEIAPQVENFRLPIAAATVVLAAHYIIRDLDDGGPHLILLAILTAAIYWQGRRRQVPAALLFGLATAMKATCAIFLPYLAWKREWRLFALATTATLMLVTAPALRMGPSSWYQQQSVWNEVALRSAVGNPIPGAKENEERFENQALRPALTFYASGAGLRGRTGTDQGKVAAHFAEAASITGAVFLLLLFSLESSRSNPSDRGAGLRDFSAVLILSLLLSPVTWVQHLVFLIPAIYLLVAQELAISPLPNLARAGLIAFAGASLLLNREILGKNLYEILLAYRLHTILMLVVVALLLTCAPMAGSRRAETA